MSGDIWYSKWSTRFPVGVQVREVFEKIDSAVKLENIEACLWINTKHCGRRVIIKLSKRKDTDRIR